MAYLTHTLTTHMLRPRGKITAIPVVRMNPKIMVMRRTANMRDTITTKRKILATVIIMTPRLCPRSTCRTKLAKLTS